MYQYHEKLAFPFLLELLPLYTEWDSRVQQLSKVRVAADK